MFHDKMIHYQIKSLITRTDGTPGSNPILELQIAHDELYFYLDAHLRTEVVTKLCRGNLEETKPYFVWVSDNKTFRVGNFIQLQAINCTL